MKPPETTCGAKHGDLVCALTADHLSAHWDATTESSWADSDHYDGPWRNYVDDLPRGEHEETIL